MDADVSVLCCCESSGMELAPGRDCWSASVEGVVERDVVRVSCLELAAVLVLVGCGASAGKRCCMVGGMGGWL